MSIFSDRRPWRQIGGIRGYLRQVSWSLWWRLEWHRRTARPPRLGDREAKPLALAGSTQSERPPAGESAR